MSDRYIQLHNPEGDLLYPRTEWRVILNKPSFATLEQLATKQDKLTSANSGPGILIETGEGGLLRISATQVSDYNSLANRPSINNVTLQGNLTLGALGINYNDNTTDGAFELADESGNVALRVTNQGHLVTKMFNSEDLPSTISSYVSAYHDSTKQDISTLATAIQNNHFVQFTTGSNLFNFLGGDYSTPILSVNMTTGAIVTPTFTITSGNLLSDANAGTNITITRDNNNIWKINAIGGGGGGGVTSYNALTDKPTFEGLPIQGAYTYLSLNLPKITSEAGAPFEIMDSTGNVALRINDQGHLIVKSFDSSEAITINNLSSYLAAGNYITSSYIQAQGSQGYLTTLTVGGIQYAIPSGGGGGTSGVTSLGGKTGAILLPQGSYLTINNNNELSVTGLVPVSATGNNGVLSTITVGGTQYTVPSGGGGTSGVTELGGMTGSITLAGSLQADTSRLVGYYRAIQVNGSEQLSSLSSTPLNFVNGTNINFSYTNNAVTASVPLSNASTVGVVRIAAGTSVSVAYSNAGVATITGKYTCTLNGTELTIEENYA